MLLFMLVKRQDDCSFYNINYSDFNKTLKSEQVVFQSMCKKTRDRQWRKSFEQTLGLAHCHKFSSRAPNELELFHGHAEFHFNSHQKFT
jgi:hypothetical protein